MLIGINFGVSWPGFNALIASVVDAITGLVVTGPGGTLIDRFGARRVLIVGLLAMIAGCTLLAYATHPAVATVAVVLIGINFGVSWPGFNALIASVVD
ncbi:hypothetical protein CTI14_57545, partial [Methylobacterium radiotolerans]